MAGASSCPSDFSIRIRNAWSRARAPGRAGPRPRGRAGPSPSSRLLLSEPSRELRADGQLGRGQLHRPARLGLGHAFHLEQDAAGADDDHPALGRALALAHSGFERLLGDRLVGEHAHPDLAATLDEPRHRDAGRLDLPVREPAGLHRLQPEVPERDVGAAPGLACHAPALLLPELDLLRHQHDDFSLRWPAACLSAPGPMPLGTTRAPAPAAVADPDRDPDRGIFFAAHARREALALVHPDLDADLAVGRLRLGEAVVDVRAQRLQRQLAVQVPLRAGDLGAVQAAGHAHLDAARAEAQRRLHGLAHRAAERHALLELHGDRLGHQLRVQLRLLDLLDVDEDLALGAALDLLLQLVDLRALAPDDDAGTRRCGCRSSACWPPARSRPWRRPRAGTGRFSSRLSDRSSCRRSA